MQRVRSNLQDSLDKKLKERVKNHKIEFVKVFTGRYHEMIPSLINYHNNNTGIDFLKVEVMLMNNYDVVLGQATNGTIQILGYVESNNSSHENPLNFFTRRTLEKRDINFTLPREYIPKEMKEISSLDEYKTGNFTVITNKTINYISDSRIIDYYVASLSEVALSRFSLAMQAKVVTLFFGEENDEDVNQLVTDIYNGSPAVKIGSDFDIDDQIYHMENNGIASQFAELKREYQNILTELNNMLGINDLAVDKESGVSNVEANSSKPFTNSTANIKLSSREKAINSLNKRFNLDIKVGYNDEVTSELNNLFGKEEEKDKEGEEDGKE